MARQNGQLMVMPMKTMAGFEEADLKIYKKNIPERIFRGIEGIRFLRIK